VDAAHPFAAQLHQTIAEVSAELQIPVVRYERIYPPRDPDITWIDDYAELSSLLPPHSSLLATTGVQSISKLKPLEKQGVKVIYRILNRESSIALAHQQGATDNQLCFYRDHGDGSPDHGDGSPDRSEARDQENCPRDPRPRDPDAILLKESGISGGFVEKVNEARQKGMRIIAIKRPEIAQRNRPCCVICNGPYGLRRAVERLLPEFYPLHSGLTTGTCATAAAMAATLQFSQRTGIDVDSSLPEEVPVLLPNGETIHVPVGYGDGYAYCIKEAGDDPDVTNGIEIRAKVSATDLHRQTRTEPKSPLSSAAIIIEGGEGVGRFTLPGFDYPPGEPAINKGPREMIRQNLEQLSARPEGTLSSERTVRSAMPLCSAKNCPLGYAALLCKELSIVLSVPDGAERAKRTFNPRLGIEGGISIIGVSGIVKPFSEEAFIDSIRKCMEVAKASGSERVVINSGGKSERFVRVLYPELPRQAFVEYGNFIGETLKIAHELHFKTVTLGVMLGKAVKLAAGHLDTHSRKTTMDLDFIRQMLQESGIAIDISDITLARELWERIPTPLLAAFATTVIRHCADHCSPLLPDSSLTILLIDDEGHIYQR
jgi:cobalt-precorrin-5B (C1)-methyltransferase